MPIRLKSKMYMMVYCVETWSLRSLDAQLHVRSEMRMWRWMLGVTLRDKLTNEEVRRRDGVAAISNKIREEKLRWFWSVTRSGEDCIMHRIMNAPVLRQHSRG